MTGIGEFSVVLVDRSGYPVSRVRRGLVSDLIDFSMALARIVLGMVALIAGLAAINIVVYISAVGSTFDDEVAAIYNSSFERGYAQTYEAGYQEAHGLAYEEGYGRAYEVARGGSSGEITATRVELRNPTYNELKEFLAQDNTESKSFIKGEYVCFDFAAELNNNAEASGIRAAYVRIHAEQWGHAVVAFETVDRGLIFIEPQSDKEVELVRGQSYPWQVTGASRPSDYDDVIDDIEIMW